MTRLFLVGMMVLIGWQQAYALCDYSDTLNIYYANLPVSDLESENNAVLFGVIGSCMPRNLTMLDEYEDEFVSGRAQFTYSADGTISFTGISTYATDESEMTRTKSCYLTKDSKSVEDGVVDYGHAKQLVLKGFRRWMMYSIEAADPGSNECTEVGYSIEKNSEMY